MGTTPKFPWPTPVRAGHVKNMLGLWIQKWNESESHGANGTWKSLILDEA